MTLLSAVEQLLCDQPRLHLCEAPSPVSRLSAVSSHLPMSEVYVKDDGALHTLYGGNKVRKLEFILGDAIERGIDTLWTVGGIGSHHVLATALHAQAVGLRCRVFHVPQPATEQVLTTLMALIAAEPNLTLLTPPTPGERLNVAVRSQIDRWLRSGHTELGESPYFIPSGGSSMRGTIGYVLAAFELKRDIDAGRLPMVDRIYLAAGSGSTIAGLALGLSIAGLNTDLIGVRVVSKHLVNEKVVAKLIRETATFIEGFGIDLSHEVARVRVHILSGYLGLGYGHHTERGERALCIAAEDGLELDPIYTAKAFGALLEQSQSQLGVTLFWQTLSTARLDCQLRRARELGGFERLPSQYKPLISQV